MGTARPLHQVHCRSERGQIPSTTKAQSAYVTNLMNILASSYRDSMVPYGPFSGCPLILVATFLVRGELPVPLYYFHVRRGQVTVLDQDGADLTDFTEAEKEATRRGQEIAARDGPTNRGSIIVADQNWRRLWEVPF